MPIRNWSIKWGTVIRVSSSTNPLVYDWNDIPFRICRLELTSPNGFEVWTQQVAHAITWDQADVSNVKLEYSLNNGSSWTEIINSVLASSGSYDWTAPVANSDLCLVRVTDSDYPNINDASDVNFTIRPPLKVTSPNGGEILLFGYIHSILWLATNDVSFVLIDYSINNGTNWIPIQTTPYPASIGIYNWNVPDVLSVNCLVRVRNYSNGSVYDVSDAVFTIGVINPPIVDFVADVTEGYFPLSVQFTDLSSAGTGIISQWLWSFGDGTTSSEQNPLHVYQNIGLYPVSLTITNSYNASNTLLRTDYINVLPRIPLLEVTPPITLNIGEAYLGYYSQPHDLWIKNTGTATVAVSSISLYLTNSPFSFPLYFAPVEIAEGDSIALPIVFTPQVQGAVIDTLYIANNSQNLPLAVIRLTGYGTYVPPKPPENVNIAMNGYDAVITWDAVTQTIFDTPITPDYYLVFYNGSSDPENGLYYYLWDTAGLQFSHHLVGLHANYMFYRVVAYKYYGRGSFDIASIGLVPGMPEDEVMRRLRE